MWGYWYSCFRVLVTSILGFKARVNAPLVCFIFYTKWILQIHLWCYTCWWPALQLSHFDPLPFSSIGGLKTNATMCDRCAIHVSHCSSAIWSTTLHNGNSRYIGIFLNVFTEFNDKNICHYSKRFKPATWCVRHQDATTAPARHM